MGGGLIESVATAGLWYFQSKQLPESPSASGGTQAANDSDGAKPKHEEAFRKERMNLWDGVAAAAPSIQTVSSPQANQWVDSLVDGRDKSWWAVLEGQVETEDHA